MTGTIDYMRITMDVSSVVYNRGVSFYTTNLVRALAAVLAESDQLALFGASFGKFASLKNFSRNLGVTAKLYPVPPSLASFALQTINWPIDAFIAQSDIFHTWEWYLPTATKAQIVITIHDVALFKFPQLAHPQIEKQHRIVMERIKKLKPTIIAVSQSTKDDLVEVCGLSPELIHVVHEAIPLEHQLEISQQQLLEVKQTYGLNRPYLLMVGTAEPRKNFVRQIQAWKRVSKDFDLVIVGAVGWETLPQETGIIRIVEATAPELVALYQGASLLLYCSLYEGFGLPILEAFYHGLPVVTAHSSAMAEIGAAAVTQVDPSDVQSIEAGIRASLEGANALRDAGTIRLKDFSWQKAASQTYAVYTKACQP